MRVLITLVLFVMMFCVSCADTNNVTSGEIYCDALLNCSEVDSDPDLSFDLCVQTYNSNPCDSETQDSCYRSFTLEEKECLLQYDSCEFWDNYEKCLK